MPRIRCRYENCYLLDDGYCSAANVEIDPDTGCVTYSIVAVDMDDDWVVEDEFDEWDKIDVSNSKGDDDYDSILDDDLWLDDDI